MARPNPDDMTFWDHIEELRWHLMRAGAAILIGSIVAFICKGFIFDTLLFGPMQLDFPTYSVMCKLDGLLHLGGTLCVTEMPFTLINLEMAGQFTAHFNISMVVGISCAFPYVLWELWKFIKPGLRETERKASTYMISICSLLFFLGLLFGYFLISPFSILFLGGYRVSEMVQSQINLGSYVSTLTMICLSSALLFELPVLIFVLSKLGIVTPKFLKKYRKHSVIAILFLAAIITPPDITSQIVVSIPVLVLYEVGILVSARVQAAKLKAENEDLENMRYK